MHVHIISDLYFIPGQSASQASTKSAATVINGNDGNHDDADDATDNTANDNEHTDNENSNDSDNEHISRKGPRASRGPGGGWSCKLRSFRSTPACRTS